MRSIVLALLGSLCFAFSNVAIHRGLQGTDYFTGLLVNLASNAVLLWIFLAFTSERAEIWVPVNFIFLGVGLVVPGLARYFIFKGMERLGSSISSVLLNSAPLFAILFALFFLEEIPTLTNLAGALFIVGGIVSLSWKGESRTWRTADLGFPLAAAFLFALRDNLVRFGLLIIQSPILGASIAATTSAVTMGAVYLTGESRRNWEGASGKGLWHFFVSGFLNFLSYVFMYTALALDRVSIVSPLVNSSSLFLLPIAHFMLRDVEQITARKIYAAGMVLFGVFLISWEKL